VPKLSLPLRLVLDTNIWLDWLVFNDQGIAPIEAAVGSGQAGICIDAACEQELVRVLTYPLPKRTLDAASQAACLAECRRLTQMAKTGERESANAKERDCGRLPVCRDPSDQKFLELARDCRADFLVTKDLALLALARRKIQRLPFCIVTPQQFAGALGIRT
jgi:putative PIN family toxin of toxin-antitoxin system